jgi:hypothetical protein
VALGQAGETLTLGPNTSVHAPRIVVLSPDVRVETRGTPDGGVLLVCEHLLAETPDVQIRCYGPSKLEIATAGEPPYPWAQYRVAPPSTPDGAQADITSVMADLARLVTWFKSAGFGGLGMYVKPLDAAAAKGRVSRGLLDYSLERGLITREGGLYSLHPEQFGLSLQQVKAKIPSDSVRRFLEEYLAQSA